MKGDFTKRIRTALFGTRWIVLIEDDGECSVKKVEFMNGRAMVNRYTHSCYPVLLLADGIATGGYRSLRWEPYDPSAPKRWPVPRVTAAEAE
jgi:hypothetical protein